MGSYALLLPVGHGGMGTVYLARREVVAGVHRDFAIKLLHPQVEADEDLAAALLREARVAAVVRHPNVVMTVEAIERETGVALVMDYVEGETLAGLIRAARRDKRRIPLNVVLKIMLDALDGLQAAHDTHGPDGQLLGLVHRDFSPQNILVGVDGVARLTDFGVAKVTSRRGVTATGVAKGKIGYMSPEQARGASIDRRTDVWAAGVVLWEALTGQRLFRRENDAATLLALLSDEARPSVLEHCPEAPVELDDIIADATVLDRQQRIRDAAALRQRIETAARDLDPATPEDVGRFVLAQVGESLQRRREQAEQAWQRLGDAAADESPKAALAATLASVVSDAPSVPKPERRSFLSLLAAVPLVVGAAVAWWAMQSSATAQTFFPSEGWNAASVPSAASTVSEPPSRRSVRIDSAEPLVEVAPRPRVRPRPRTGLIDDPYGE